MERDRIIRRRELNKTRRHCQAAFTPVFQAQAALPWLWHVTCGHIFKNRLMAAKMRMLKLLMEIRGFAEVTNRSPQPRISGAHLTQLRSSLAHAALPKRRLSIPIDQQSPADVPHQVKITHLKSSPGSAATLRAS